MAAALGMCFVFKTVVSPCRSNNTFKIFKMVRESFKEYSKAATVEKEELLLRDEILPKKRSFIQAAKTLNGKRNYIFHGNVC